MVVKRSCANPVSVEAFGIFNQGAIPECDSCGADSDCESGTWSSALVGNDIHVPPFAVEVLGDGEPSDLGWDLGSECGSVAVSGAPVAPDVSGTAPSVVTVMCEGAHSDSEWAFFWNRSLFPSPRSVSSLVWKTQEDMNYEVTLVKAPPCHKKRMRTPLLQQSSSSTREEESPWSAQERTATARM